MMSELILFHWPSVDIVVETRHILMSILTTIHCWTNKIFLWNLPLILLGENIFSVEDWCLLLKLFTFLGLFKTHGAVGLFDANLCHIYWQAQSQLQLCWTELVFIFGFPHPHPPTRESTETWYLSLMCVSNQAITYQAKPGCHRKTTS